jgi:quercetin dioxygenase-like cupin family protein
MIRILLAAALAAGAILKEADGEHRVHRPPPGALSSLNAPFIIKVDPKNVGSTDFFLLTEDIAPGQAIPAHRHPNAEEIIFIHAGQGLASLDGRETTVATGATIFHAAQHHRHLAQHWQRAVAYRGRLLAPGIRGVHADDRWRYPPHAFRAPRCHSDSDACPAVMACLIS